MVQEHIYKHIYKVYHAEFKKKLFVGFGPAQKLQAVTFANLVIDVSYPKHVLYNLTKHQKWLHRHAYALVKTSRFYKYAF